MVFAFGKAVGAVIPDPGRKKQLASSHSECHNCQPNLCFDWRIIASVKLIKNWSTYIGSTYLRTLTIINFLFFEGF
jgi:hypothetical protein